MGGDLRANDFTYALDLEPETSSVVEQGVASSREGSKGSKGAVDSLIPLY